MRKRIEVFKSKESAIKYQAVLAFEGWEIGAPYEAMAISWNADRVDGDTDLQKKVWVLEATR